MGLPANICHSTKSELSRKSYGPAPSWAFHIIQQRSHVMLTGQPSGMSHARPLPLPPMRRWKINHVDLSREIPDLSCPAQTQGIYLFFWWDQVPLGHIELYDCQLPLSASQWLNIALPRIAETVGSYVVNQGFKAPWPCPRPCANGNFEEETQAALLSELLSLNHPLATLLDQQKRVAEAVAHQSVSIVISTRDRPQKLENCLQSLSSLGILPDEIIVVDNAPSSNETRELVASHPNVRYILEPCPGLSKARNTGILAATSELVAFTDDDVVVHPYWVQQLRTAFLDPKVMAMTGLVLPAQLDSETEYIFEKGVNGFCRGYRKLNFDYNYFRKSQRFGVPTWHFGAGANMAFRRVIFEKLGGFDVRLGAGASGCSEDSEMWYRILADGWSCQYCPSAVVSHFHRSDQNALREQISAYMQGHVVALIVQATRHQHWGNIRRLLIVLPRYYAKRLILAILNKFQGEHSYLFSELRGYLMGFVYYLLHSSISWHMKCGFTPPVPTKTGSSGSKWFS